jgi:hypothetical protein
MVTDTAHHSAEQAPIDHLWLNCSHGVFDRLLLCGSPRGRRAELLILTARINFNP